MVELNTFLHPELQPISGGDGLLKDLKIAIKDNISVQDWPLTAGSKILEGYISPYDATVITKLKEVGATLVGKTNLDEFAMGSSTENSAFGPTKNPWDPTRVPGGSSGGSAAAVAADQCDVALGSDTGGSIRQPAAFCGVTGLKPTYGSVSRYGLVALASSLDVIGPLARDAATVEKVFAAISGRDENDQTTIDYSYQSKTQKIAGLKVGLPKQLWQLEIEPDITFALQELVEFFRSHGADIQDVDLPGIELALPAYYIILPAEASSNLARYDGIRYKSSVEADNLLERYLQTRSQGFGAEVKRRILLGTYALSVGHYDQYYQTAEKVRQNITTQFNDALEKFDVLLSPTTPTLPFELGSRTQDPVKMYQSDLMTVAVNLAGNPALSMPCGFSAGNLPIGAQLIGPSKGEDIILSLAKQYQEETNWHTRVAPAVKEADG